MSDPRAAVLTRLAARYDMFSENEQLLVGVGKYVEAEGAHQFALRILRAYEAESRDPAPAYPIPEHPHFWPIPGCARCDGVVR